MSLYLTNISITVTESMTEEKYEGDLQNVNVNTHCDSVKKECECVELGDLQQKDECREKAPRRVIHFSSGETMEEYSTEDEDDHTHTQPDKNNLLSSVDASKLTWGPYVWFQMWRAATNTVSACDYVGERMASLFGLTSAKYQYAINQYHRSTKQKENEARDSPVSEEAESHFEGKQKEEIQEQNFDKSKVDEPEILDTETRPDPEILDAETRPEPEILDAETRPDPEILDAETRPDPEILDAETRPDPEILDAETRPDPEILDTETRPEPEILDAETRPDPEIFDAETRPDPEILDTETRPDPEILDTETRPEPEILDAETRPEPEILDAETRPDPEILDAETRPEPEILDAETRPGNRSV